LQIFGFSRFESIVIKSVEDALNKVTIDVSSERTCFILSTTKANVEDLLKNNNVYFSPAESASRIAQYFGIITDPIVVCNACISGVNAQLLAFRLINSGLYDNAIVCGADCQSPFIVSGFLSFKSLSPYECKPFDIDRLGLNLGEAAATIILGKSVASETQWKLYNGHLNNDAFHVSAPSPIGDGTLRVIEKTLSDQNVKDLALVSVHGTATMFNDQMESKAIEKEGLSSIPISAIKGYFGHTLGAAGILETIITMRALDDGCILPVRGYNEIGVSGKISIDNKEHKTDRSTFLKIISGFGGCNGALLFSKDNTLNIKENNIAKLNLSHSIKITSNSLFVDEKQIETKENGKSLIAEIYKTHINNYPKFYKMDTFCKLVFIASELLINLDNKLLKKEEERAIILFNSTSSIVTDKKFVASIKDKNNFFPSPSVFLYTLPNIVTGEIAIKNGYKGETSFYVLRKKNEELMSQIIQTTYNQSSNIRSIITESLTLPPR
jgi:3-oxoacyl-[acyl-carrier-protein] synthase-1